MNLNNDDKPVERPSLEEIKAYCRDLEFISKYSQQLNGGTYGDTPQEAVVMGEIVALRWVLGEIDKEEHEVIRKGAAQMAARLLTRQ